jgi:hypothetical protein
MLRSTPQSASDELDRKINRQVFVGLRHNSDMPFPVGVLPFLITHQLWKLVSNGELWSKLQSRKLVG